MPSIRKIISQRFEEHRDHLDRVNSRNDSEASVGEKAIPARDLNYKRETVHQDTHMYSLGDLPVYKDGLEFKNQDPDLVTWESPEDPANPRNWSGRKKWMVTILAALNAFVPTFSTSVIAPAMGLVAAEFGYLDNQTLMALTVSIFLLPWALVPLVASPLSEMYGRRVVTFVSLWVLLAFNLGCCFAKTKEQLIVFRFFAGVGGAAPLSIGAGVIGDCFNAVERNKAIGIFGIGLIMAPVVSPIVCGYVSENVGWRWTFRVLVIMNGATVIANHIFLPELYSPTILGDKKKKLLKENPEKDYHTIYDITEEEHGTQRLVLNIIRPVQLLIYHPMVYGLGILLSVIYGLLYLIIVVFPALWVYKYHYSIGTSGLMFVSLGIGFLLGIAIFTPWIDKSYARLTANNGGVAKPEYRLETLLYGGVVGPGSVLAFGWCAEKHTHWILPCIFSALFCTAVVNCFQTINNYVIDMNPRFGASSVAAVTVFRSLFGFIFPLFAPKMFGNIGYGWGMTIFFFIGILVGVPYPLFAYLRGERVRNWGNEKIENLNRKRLAKYIEKLNGEELPPLTGESNVGVIHTIAEDQLEETKKN